MRRVLVLTSLLGACGGAPPPAAAPAPVIPRAVLTSHIDALVTGPAFRNAHWGVLIVDPVSGDTVYSRNAGKLFMPASNQKILTASTALVQLGPDFRFTTQFVSSAPIVNGVLRGDLLVFGRGDPSMSNAMMGNAMRPLRAAADSLWALGVREISGSLVKGGNAFPDTTLGFGWEWDDLETPSGAAIDELFFNEGVSRVTVYGGAKAGDPVRIGTWPARTVPRVVADFKTSPRSDSAARRTLTWASDMRGDRPVIHLAGSVGVRDSVAVEVALRDPAGAWLDAFAEALRDRGIVLRGKVVRAPASLPDKPRLFALSSPPLSEILPPFLKPSQNQIGELLFLTLGLEKTGSGTGDSAQRVVERQLTAWGIDSTAYAVRDGSGLSRHDYVTPEAIVHVLDAMVRDKDFRTFYEALPIAGVDGTIANRMVGTRAQANVHAKTGTVDKARSLSGYVTTADGRFLIFSFLCNNFTVPNRDVERVQDAILVRLATTAFPRR